MSEYDQTKPPSDGEQRHDESIDQTIDSDGALAEQQRKTRTQEPASAEIDQQIGKQIGPYRILEELGEGGMGSVYLAEQREPVRRRVALKVIKAGMDSKQVIGRFEAERQALAMMNHPNIAKVLDAGMTDEGRPFFVMELVKGTPITEYCDKRGMTINDRLGLLIDVCHAVQHAHQKGIIHRDIKPSNVLVSAVDGIPNVKVIDFGLAKATGQQLTDKTLFTLHGQMVGTPAYMSPEQAEGEMDIDARTDVYSLGVLLYELLTGVTPIDLKQLRKASRAELQRLICEQNPPRMSTRLSSMGNSDSRADDRATDVRHLAGLLRGDLDVVVMKALEKDRARRYVTPSSFAEDINRYIREEPVIARPPSASYLIKKFVRRNRASVLTASVVLLAIVIGSVFSGWQAIRATTARNAVTLERGKAEKALKAEQTANETATKRLSQLEGINAILASVFRDLDPEEEQQGGRPIVAQLGDRLDEATKMIDGESIGDPLMVSNLQVTLGDIQRKLGRFDKATDLAEKAVSIRENELGPKDPQTLEAIRLLGEVYADAGNYPTAIEQLERARQDYEAELGSKNSDTIKTMSILAGVYGVSGELKKGLELQKEAYSMMEKEYGPTDKRTIDCLRRLSAQTWRGAFSEDEFAHSKKLAEETLNRVKEHFGEDHFSTLKSAVEFAKISAYQGDHEKAIEVLKSSLDKARKKVGPDHLFTISIVVSLAVAHNEANEFEQGIELLEEVTTRLKRKLGEDHPQALGALNELAYTYEKAGRPQDAIRIHTETYQTRKSSLGDNHPDTLVSLSNLAYCFQQNKQYQESVDHYEKAVLGLQAKIGKDSDETLGCMNNYGLALMDNEDYSNAEEVFATSTAIQKEKYPENWATFRTQARLGRALLKQDKFAEAESNLIDGYEGMKPHEEEEISNAFRKTMESLILLYETRDGNGDTEAATKWKAALKTADSPQAPSENNKHQTNSRWFRSDPTLRQLPIS